MARTHASRARPVSMVRRLKAGALRASITVAIAGVATASGMPSVHLEDRSGPFGPDGGGGSVPSGTPPSIQEIRNSNSRGVRPMSFEYAPKPRSAGHGG